jgi:hypothetical protein
MAALDGGQVFVHLSGIWIGGCLGLLLVQIKAVALDLEPKEKRIQVVGIRMNGFLQRLLALRE